MNDQLILVHLMRKRYVELQTKNPAYSIRAYAKKLGMGASTMSMIMSGQRKASKKMAKKIADRLGLDPVERASVTEMPKDYKHVVHYLQVSRDQFQAFTEWHYLAILNLVRLKTFKNDPTWIASRLGITEKKASQALERLIRLELLTEKNGKLTRTQNAYRTTDDIADAALRKAHHQTLELAKESLDQDSVEDRDVTAITLAVKKSDMKEIKEMIRKFQNEFANRFGTNPDADEVYRLGMQMFPLTKKGKEI